MQVISRTIQSIEVGTPATFGGLTLYPLIQLPGAGRRDKPDYLTLEKGISSRAVKITEVGRGGSVPELQLVNEGDYRVLILDGEMLIGAKQNRVLNITILAPGKSRISVPVSCVEAGRWHDVSREFSASMEVMYAGGRARKMEQVNLNLEVMGAPMADQSSVWSHLAGKASRMRAQSPTSDMKEIYERYQKSISDYEKEFSPVPGQVGAIFALGDQLVGLELFEHPEILSEYLPRLVRSNALDALELPEKGPEPPAADATAEFLRDLDRADFRTYPGNFGEGESYRIDGPRVSGAALVADDRVIHLSAFRKEDEVRSNGEGNRRNIINLLRWRRNR